MALLEHDLTDPQALTAQRFERMSLVGRRQAPAGRHHRPAARPVVAGADADGRAVPVPALVPPVAAPDLRPDVHRPAGPRRAAARAVHPARGHQGDLRRATPRSSTPARATRSSARSWASTRCSSRTAAEHKRARKLLMPAFNGQALRDYQELVTDLARDEVAHWPADRTFASLDRMNALTLEVILRVVFGVTDEQRLAALRPRVNATVDINPAVMLAGPTRRCRGSARLTRGRAEPAGAGPADVRRDPRAAYGAGPGRAHRRPVPADPRGAGLRRPHATGSATSSCATSSSRCCSPATRRPRPRWRGRSTSWAATPS